MVTISNDAQRRALLLCLNLIIVCPVMLPVKGPKYFHGYNANYHSVKPMTKEDKLFA
jgi:hypothetical protein